MKRLALFIFVAATHLANPLAADEVRVATFNLALYGARSGEILERLGGGDDPQAQRLAEIIQRVRPDVLVLNEIDYDPEHQVLNAFAGKYLAVAQKVSKSPAGPAQPLKFAHRWSAPSNTGRHSGFDLDRNGTVATQPGDRNYGGDSWGFGVYEGQYAFAVLSRYPIDEAAVRTFQNFRWRDMPEARLPDNPDTPEPGDWYSKECLEKFRLSSKNHCDVPVIVNGRPIHLLVSHPTPPVFDGAEDRNGRRNQDELRFWRDYVGVPEDSTYIYDDKGGPGGLSAPSSSDLQPPASSLRPPSFLIVGDLNGDPHDGEGSAGINNLLASPRLLKHPFPASAGATEAARLQGGANAHHQGDPKHDTCDPADSPGPGNLHLDYILPSADLKIADSGVFWPETSDPLHALVAGAERPASSDHRLVWADITWEGNDE
jgi:3-phytase